MGWNGSDRRGNSTPVQPKAAAKKPSPIRGIVAGLVVVILALAGAWYFLGDSLTSTAPKDKKTKTIKKVEHAKAAVDRKQSVEVEAQVVEIGEDIQGSETRNTADAQPADAKKEEKPKPKRVFKSGTDELIAMVMSNPPGGQMPPLPAIGPGETKHFLESLKKPIEIDKDDSDHVKAIKELVQNTREEIVKLMEENPNLSFADILQEHRKINNENVDIRGKTIAELQKIIDEGDIEGAMKFRTTMNFALQQMGIEEMDTPITAEEKAEAEAREEAEAAEEEARIAEEQKAKEQKK